MGKFKKTPFTERKMKLREVDASGALSALSKNCQKTQRAYEEIDF